MSGLFEIFLKSRSIVDSVVFWLAIPVLQNHPKRSDRDRLFDPEPSA
jgi:hypothetical protein